MLSIELSTCWFFESNEYFLSNEHSNLRHGEVKKGIVVDIEHLPSWRHFSEFLYSSR